MRNLVLAVQFLALLAAGGCGWFKSAPPSEVAAAPLEVTITADAKLNPDDREQSLPTAIRIYQLRSARKFEAAEFDQIYRQAKEVLGEDLLQFEEIVVSPGTTVKQRVDRDKAAKALALVAVVRRPSGMTWRAIVDLPAATERTDLAFLVEGYRIGRK